MTINVTSPITGSAQTGLTSPTYTIVADIAPAPNGRQYAVTSLGGTQTGVTTHSVASPFTITAYRPQTFRSLGKAHPVTGVVSDVPNNVYSVLVRKGVTPLSGQPFAVATVKIIVGVPAGSDTVDAANVRAMLSAGFGVIAQQSAGVGDTAVSGVL